MCQKRASDAPRFINVLKSISFNTNSKKTFLEGFYRESCGAFQFRSTDLTCFEFTWCENFSDTIALCNKLKLIIDAGQVSQLVLDVLIDAHHDIKAEIPLICRGPMPYYSRLHLSSYVYDDNWEKAKKSCGTSRKLFQTLMKKHWGFITLTQSPIASVCMVKIPMYVPKCQKVAREWQLANDLSSLYALRFTKPVIKGKGVWVIRIYFVLLLIRSSGNSPTFGNIFPIRENR